VIINIVIYHISIDLFINYYINHQTPHQSTAVFKGVQASNWGVSQNARAASKDDDHDTSADYNIPFLVQQAPVSLVSQADIDASLAAAEGLEGFLYMGVPTTWGSLEGVKYGIYFRGVNGIKDAENTYEVLQKLGPYISNLVEKDYAEKCFNIIRV
jgi:hypothetical protein